MFLKRPLQPREEARMSDKTSRCSGPGLPGEQDETEVNTRERCWYLGTIAPLCREHETTACTKAGLRKVAATPRPSLTVLECGVCTRVAWPALVFCLHVTSVTGVNTVICLQNLTRFRSARPDFTLALPSQAVGKQCYVLLRIRLYNVTIFHPLASLLTTNRWLKGSHHIRLNSISL